MSKNQPAAQTLPDANQTIGKMVVTFDPVMRL